MQANRKTRRFSAARRSDACNPTGMLVGGLFLAVTVGAAPPQQIDEYVLEPGHPSLQEWLLPEVSSPSGAPAADAVIELGRRLFFEPGLSRDGGMSCASCHVPALGWSDGLPIARGRNGKSLERGTPTLLNAAFNQFQMWDGRFETLEEQVWGPITSSDEMGSDLDHVLGFINSRDSYRVAFADAFPGERQPIDETRIKMAIAAFERTLVSRDSPFDRWVQGDASALSPEQVAGFAVFLDPERGNCAVCHAPPNFTDDGFHNIGLASFGEPDPDLGRYAERPVASMRGAFKTPTLRNIALTAPYFHDGSADTLGAVIEHYASGGAVKSNLSPNMTELSLSPRERQDLIAFLQALTGRLTAPPDRPGDGHSPDPSSDAPGVHISAIAKPDQPDRREDIE